MGKASWDREGGMIVSVLLERSGEQRQIGLERKRKGGELKSTETYRFNMVRREMEQS